MIDINKFVTGLCKTIFGRTLDVEELSSYKKPIETERLSPHEMVREFLKSDEQQLEQSKNYLQQAPVQYTPTDLSISHINPTRIALIGPCFFEDWAQRISLRCIVDRITSNNLAILPDPGSPETYDLNVVTLNLRAIIPEQLYFRLVYSRNEDYHNLFETSRNRLTQMLAASMEWNRKFGILTFVCNFMVPQINPLGRFAPQYDYCNPVYLIDQLNQELAREIQKYQNSWIVDVNQLSANFGRKNHQDDVLSLNVHHSLLSDFDFGFDQHRIELPRRATEQFNAQPEAFIDAAWEEIVAMYRTAKGYDAIKLVIIDLDDTLWRGIAAENAFETFGYNVIEGWPLGIIEALLYLKQRGILLAIASKNDEARIRELWPEMTGNRILLSDFAVAKINWKPKVENIQDILHDVNLLPKNVLFIDDNPVERAAVKNALPEIRVLGENPYVVRHVLLRAPELQGVTITEESARRTEMIQSQVKRETDREAMSRESFLQSLSLKLSMIRMTETSHPRFARAFELLNKTNQFNTTGKRWSFEEINVFLQEKGQLLAFEVSDIYTNYGLVGVVLVKSADIVQWAMSCRVLGLDVEQAAAREIVLDFIELGVGSVTAEVVPTEANMICRNIYERCGFHLENEKWRLDIKTMQWPPYPHVQVTWKTDSV